MAIINVVKAFTFQHDPEETGKRFDEKLDKEVPVFAPAGRMQRFEVGRYEVDDWFAAHWYVRPHLEGYVQPPPPVGAPDFLQQQLQAGQAAREGISMEEAAPKPAPLPANVEMAQPIMEATHTTGGVSPDAHYFAGKRLPEQPTPPSISYMGRPS